MVISKIHISKLKAADYNPRKELKPGDAEYEKLKRSLTEFGFVEPLVWNKLTGNVVGGHQRLSVLKDLGHTDIDCVVVELDELKEKALNIALNRIQGSWDNDKLATLLSELDTKTFDVTMTGFDAAEIDELLNNFYSAEAVEDNFDTDKEHEEIKNKGSDITLGDIFILGNHKILCGDSTQLADYSKLLCQEKAQLAVTSPPPCGQKEYQKDGLETWVSTTKTTIQNLCKHSSIVVWNMGDMYSTGTQFVEPTSVHSVQMFGDCGLRPIWIRIWKKTRNLTAVAGYHLVTTKPIPQYEYVTAYVSGATREADLPSGQSVAKAGSNLQLRPGEESEYNDQEYVWLSAFAGHSYKFVKRLTKDERKKWGYSGIWDMPPVKTHQDTISAVPVELPWRCIKMHSDRDGIVLEPYLGNGTTLIACEQTGRRCFAMESDPIMLEVAIKRWESFTGLKAVKQC